MADGVDGIVAGYAGGEKTKYYREGVVTYKPEATPGGEAILWAEELAGVDRYLRSNLHLPIIEDNTLPPNSMIPERLTVRTNSGVNALDGIKVFN